MVMNTENEEKPQPSMSEVLDYHVMCASGAALEIADQNEHPFLTHSSQDFSHKITSQSRPVFALLYAGPDAHEVGQRIAHYAKSLLEAKSSENKSE